MVCDAERILLIRDRYGYWAFPKGHLERAETPEEAALREVAEETGVLAVIKGKLGTIRYQVVRGPERLAKEVHYFLLAGEGPTRPQLEEIDRAEWFSWNEAEALLRKNGYPANLEIFQRARSRFDNDGKL